MALTLVVLVAVIVVRSNSMVLVDAYPRLNSYRVVDERAIVLTVAVAPRSWTRVTGVAETTTEVTVTVESLDWPIPGPGTAELVLLDLEVSLVDELGVRVVRDADGQTVPLRSPSE